MLIFELKPNGSAELRRTLNGHDAPVTALAASNKHLVSADESGDVRVWDAESSYAQSSAFASSGCVCVHRFRRARARAHEREPTILCARYPCTSVGIREDVVAAGYSTGHLRIFRTRTSELVVEVAAHSRCINAIDVAAHQPLVRPGAAAAAATRQKRRDRGDSRAGGVGGRGHVREYLELAGL